MSEISRPQTNKSRAKNLVSAGARDTLPILLGIIPFGAIAGISTTAAGVSTGSALALGIGVFAGAAHLAAVELLDRKAPLMVVVLAALIVNLRYLMYSAGLAPHFSNLSSSWKRGLSYLLTDQAFAISTDYYRKNPTLEGKRWYYLGSALAVWLAYQLSYAMGLTLGVAIPKFLSLEFAIPLTFIALLMGAVSDRATMVAALSAGLASLIFAYWPYQLGLLVAGTIGIGSGLLVKSRRSK